MADLPQIDEIQALLHPSKPTSDRSFAYESLLRLQQVSADDPSLAARSRLLLPLVLSDIRSHDEETSAQALKCLGFMIYHPMHVASIPEMEVHLVVEALVELITTTNMKAICNLAVWCISIQQLNPLCLDSWLDSVVGAIVYALDNPFGSLSTTFEAMQAATKLTTQFSDKMRDITSVWVPPIYRRLLSINKQERDASERCLWKNRSCIIPPPLSLSKVLSVETKQSLLLRMKEMLQDQGQKIHAIQAWGWYIRLLGSSVTRCRKLFNEMLKIPEKAFSDPNPQVQLASQVAWEGLIDSLILPQMLPSRISASHESEVQHHMLVISITEIQNCKDNFDDLQKTIKLIMIPLIGVLSSKCATSVRLGCLKIWHSLLQKLGFSINHSLMLDTVLEPVFEVIFSRGADNRNILLWNSCLDLLDDFILSKIRDEKNGLFDISNKSNQAISTPPLTISIDSKGLLKHYSIKWLPWDIEKLEFHLKMIHIMVTRALLGNVTTENKNLVSNSALRIFRSVLKCVKVAIKSLSSYSDIQFCVDAVLKFVKKIYEDVTRRSTELGINDFFCTLLQFLEAIGEEIEFSILSSPLHAVTLDLNYINKLQCAEDINGPELPAFVSFNSLNKASPMVYLSTMYLCLALNSISNLSENENVPNLLCCSKLLFNLSGSLVNLHTVVRFLYTHWQKQLGERICWLRIWVVVMQGLKQHIGSVKCLSDMNTESDSCDYVTLYWFFFYPFVVCYSSVDSTMTRSCIEIYSRRTLEFDVVSDAWKDLLDLAIGFSHYRCASINKFDEDLCKMLTKVVAESTVFYHGDTEKYWRLNTERLFFFMFGESSSYLLKQLPVSDEAAPSPRSKAEVSNYKRCNHMQNCLDFAARFLDMSLRSMERCGIPENDVIARVFKAISGLVGHLSLKQEILLLLEKLSGPLVNWLSSSVCKTSIVQRSETATELQVLWMCILQCLERIQPPIIFDSSLLDLQAPLLQITLDHPDSSISNSTIAFWNNTYGKCRELLYPRLLVQILQKLSREGRINPRKVNRNPSSGEMKSSLQNYVARVAHKRESKCIEFTSDYEGIDATTHSMEVSGLCFGRDKIGLICDRMGEHPRKKREVRPSETILKMMRRTR